MSEKEEKQQTTKEFLAELAKGDYANLWELYNTLKSNHPDDKASFLKIFNEDQMELLKIIVNFTVEALKFHDEYEESHEAFRKDVTADVTAIDAKLRNHRHQLDKNFSAKAEF